MTRLGISYQPKVDDHMGKVIERACPTCGAQMNELCVKASGRKVTKVQDVHSARFIVKAKKTVRADHAAAI